MKKFFFKHLLDNLESLHHSILSRGGGALPLLFSGDKSNSFILLFFTYESRIFRKKGDTGYVSLSDKKEEPLTNSNKNTGLTILSSRLFDVAESSYYYDYAVTSLQSMANLDKILGAPTVPHLRCGCAKTVQKSSGAPLHHEYHCTNMKTPKSEGRPGALS